ncbi:MAG: class I SAM-dependent methyltransferase [Chitinophagales bacterium]
MKDLFSNQAGSYAKYRPGYPQQLFDYVLSFVRAKDYAWDCATGNGQAAIHLTKYFPKIAATDISEKQIRRAKAGPGIEYTICPSEKTPFPDNQFDLITVAQAYHWLQFDSFFKEATRVGRPEAIVAVWCYGLPISGVQKIDQAVGYFYKDIVGQYWDKERVYVEEEYRTIPFSFKELPSGDFQFEVEWSTQDLLGYLNTWSSVQHYIQENKMNPVDAFSNDLNQIWDISKRLTLMFSIHLRLGRIVK